MKKKHVLILFTVLALSVTSVMKLVPVSKVAASSILGGNKNESILDKLTPTPEPGKSDKNEKDDVPESFRTGIPDIDHPVYGRLFLIILILIPVVRITVILNKVVIRLG